MGCNGSRPADCSRHENLRRRGHVAYLYNTLYRQFRIFCVLVVSGGRSHYSTLHSAATNQTSLLSLLLRQLETWHCSHLLLTAVLLWMWIERRPCLLRTCRTAVDRYHMPVRPTAANWPHTAVVGQMQDSFIDTAAHCYASDVSCGTEFICHLVRETKFFKSIYCLLPIQYNILLFVAL